jgi:hypothetical protein
LVSASVSWERERERARERGKREGGQRRDKEEGHRGFLGQLQEVDEEAGGGSGGGQEQATQLLAWWRKKTCDLQKAPWTSGFSGDFESRTCFCMI